MRLGLLRVLDAERNLWAHRAIIRPARLKGQRFQHPLPLVSSRWAMRGWSGILVSALPCSVIVPSALRAESVDNNDCASAKRMGFGGDKKASEATLDPQSASSKASEDKSATFISGLGDTDNPPSSVPGPEFVAMPYCDPAGASHALGGFMFAYACCNEPFPFPCWGQILRAVPYLHQQQLECLRLLTRSLRWKLPRQFCVPFTGRMAVHCLSNGMLPCRS